MGVHVGGRAGQVELWYVQGGEISPARNFLLSKVDIG